MFKSRLLYQSPKPQLENGIACHCPFHSYLYLVSKPLILSEAEGDLVVMVVSRIIKKFSFEKQQTLYHNKVTLSLTPVQRLGIQARNCKHS